MRIKKSGIPRICLECFNNDQDQAFDKSDGTVKLVFTRVGSKEMFFLCKLHARELLNRLKDILGDE